MTSILVEKATTIVEYSVDDSDPLTNDGTYLNVEGAEWHQRPASEYTIYKSVTLPSGYDHMKFKYNGTTFTSNSDYKAPTTFEKVGSDGRPIGIFDVDDDGNEIELHIF
tara:strand:+ start:1223 stop:1549 length:327 start_codon:yes stop_codon:yes gene_type:complete